MSLSNIPNIFNRDIFVYFFYKIHAKVTSITLYHSMRVMYTDASVRFLSRIENFEDARIHKRYLLFLFLFFEYLYFLLFFACFTVIYI